MSSKVVNLKTEIHTPTFTNHQGCGIMASQWNYIHWPTFNPGVYYDK
jgi:hypothetical protein